MREQGPIRVDRVRPSLLDRLIGPPAVTDPSGAFSPAGDEPGAMREVDYRETVLRDLEWLFNSSPRLGLVPETVFQRCPMVAGSVLNYGLRGIFGSIVRDEAAMEQRVVDALRRFEPRLLVERQRLRASVEGQLVEIEIEGTLLTHRAARRLVVRTDLETEMSEVSAQIRG